MDYKKTTAPSTTITRNLSDIDEKTGNIKPQQGLFLNISQRYHTFPEYHINEKLGKIVILLALKNQKKGRYCGYF